MLRTLLFSTLLLSCVIVSAQDAAIRGRIIDQDKLALPGANVVLDENISTVSDRDGFYALTGITAGSHTLTISYIGFKSQTSSVDVGTKQTATLDFILEQGVELAEIVVSSQLVGQAKALNQQASVTNITNIIASDQIGKFPDANVGDALKRIPGISVQYDQGEARFGSIRGIAPQLNSMTVNGERIPSAEAEIRTIQLDLIPSDMVQAIEVNKSLTPDMDADAIGASVNLVTRATPYERRISGTVGGGYNVLAKEPTLNGSLIYGERFADGKLGMILSASYFDNNLGSDDLEAEWTYDDANDNDRFDEGEEFWPEEIQVRQYDLQRIRQSYSAGLDFAVNQRNTLFFKGIYNRRKDWENRYRVVYKDIEPDDDQWVTEIEREVKSSTPDNKNARLEDQQMMSFTLGGEHLLSRMKLNWSGTYSRASEDRPNERYLELSTGDVVPASVNFSDPREPKITPIDAAFQNPGDSWELSSLTEEFQKTDDVDMNGRIDLQIPLSSDMAKSNLKVGVRYRGKEKERTNDFYEFEPVDDAVFDGALANLENFSKDNFLPGEYLVGSFPNAEYVGGLNLNSNGFDKEQDLSELAGNFNASENILAGYVMLSQRIGTKLSGIVGVRVEQTRLEYQGFVYDDEEDTLDPSTVREGDYTNVLPGMHLKYQATPKTNLRFAYTNTIGRPNYFDLVPYREIEDSEDLSIGNPDLEPTLSTNFDLMAEHYFKSIGILSAGVFFKDIRDFIVTQTFDDFVFEGTEWGSFSQPINAGNATLWGIEVAAQRQLDFLPGVLAGFGVYANYTYTHSEVTDFNFEGREDDELALPGSPAHTFNFSLSYDSGKFTGRLSYNAASDFIDEVGSESFSDRYYDKVNYLDLNLGYRITKNWQVYANVNNLLNQPLRYFQGVSDRTMQAEYYNVRFDAGIKFNF